MNDEIDSIRTQFYTELFVTHDIVNLPKSIANEIASPLTFDEFQSRINSIFQHNHLTAYDYAIRFLHRVTKRKGDYSVLIEIFGELIYKFSEMFINRKEFLSLYMDFVIQKKENLLESLNILFFWDMPHIQIILKYIGREYGKYKILGDYFSKTMLRINSEQLTFYLSQIFQSLEYEFAKSIESFF